MKIGVIDIGTNSTRLLIARYQDKKIIPLYSDLEITRIGEGIGKLPYIQPQPLARTINCLKNFLSQCQKYQVDKIRVAATSAVRDAENKDLVQKEVGQAIGVELEILTGEDEAQLSYLGAVSDITCPGRAQIVLDIGGGSTELVYPTKEGLRFNSVNLGAVRLAENPDLMEKGWSILNDLFGEELPKKFTLIGVGGTVTTLVAIKLKLAKYDPQLVHGQKLTGQEVKELEDLLFNLSSEERKKLKGLQPQRADIIPYGTFILHQVMTKLSCGEIIISEKDILYGLIITALNGEC